MKRLPREFIPAVINSTGGRFFGLHFRKLDKSLRRVNGHLTSDQQVTVDKNGYMKIFDRNAASTTSPLHSGEWRNVHLNRIFELSFNGLNYKVV